MNSNEAFGWSKGTVRGIAFLMVVGSWALCNIAVVAGCAWGPVTMDQLMKYITIVVIPPVSLSFGFYFGQKMVAK